jgi:hypothetical protein
VAPQGIMHLFQPIVSQDMNDNLCKAFTDEEIGDALFHMGPLKAPGLDSFPARFFQKNWEFMKADVIKGVRHFFRTGVMPEGVNDTAIVLIPKIEQAELLKDFRPISYKVVSKCLVNRLRPSLQDIIAPMQSVFILGRLITDNTLILSVFMLSTMEIVTVQDLELTSWISLKRTTTLIGGFWKAPYDG